MHDTNIFVDSRTAYVQCGNVKRAWQRVKNEVPYSTYRQWYNENREEWKEARKEYVKELARLDAKLKNYTNELLTRLTELEEKLWNKIKDGGDGKININDVHGYLKVIREIKPLLVVYKSADYERVLDEVINQVVADPVVAPVIESRKKHILKQLSS